MKKRLLSLLGALLVSTAFVNAQTTWNFSDAAWPVTAGYTSNIVVNNLGFIPGPSTSTNLMGQVEANTATIDGIAFTQRLKMNGGSFTSGTTDFGQVPPQRAFYFKVNGNSTIKLWYKNGGGGTRTVYVSNGTNVLPGGTLPYTDSTVGQFPTITYTGPATTIYISGDQAMNFYQISATNVGTTATLAVVNNTKNPTQVYSVGNQVNIARVSGNAQIEVYTMNGALVKSLNTLSDTSFELQNKGIYIVNVKSEKSSTSQKVLIK